MQIFASDNNAGVHEDIIQAIQEANSGRVRSYGDDPYTTQASELFKNIFGQTTRTHFVFAGTAANVLALRSITRPYEAVVCTSMAHINTDECAAPENAGLKLLDLPKASGKLEPDDLVGLMGAIGSVHHAQPKVVSITQATEKGQIYSQSEIKQLAEFCKKNGLYLHMDGSRLGNAAAALDLELAELSSEAGVDVLSLGGTKNGLMFGEAILFFNPELGNNFGYYHKQNMQMYSKNRFIAAQFIALFESGLWRKNASHANKMTSLLAEKISACPKIKFTTPPQINAIFASMPEEAIEKLHRKYEFYVINPEPDETKTELNGPFSGPEVRLMTCFNTEKREVEAFAEDILKACG